MKMNDRFKVPSICAAALIVLGFLVLCANHRPMFAQPQRLDTKWEYKVISVVTNNDGSAKELTHKLDESGADGWEVTGTAEGAFSGSKIFLIILKRPKH